MNNIPKGYKQTEVGVIPEDWEVKKLGEIGSFSKGKGIRKDEVVSEGLPCIRYGEIYTTHNYYIKSFNSFITQSVANESVEIKKGDLLFAGSGETAEEIGKCVAFVGNERVFAGGDIVILRPSINNNSLFLGFLLNNQIVSRQKASMGQGDAVVHISGKNLSEIQIPIPSTKAEQTAIATALNDADALITQLEKLIAKKRNIKQGAMQELLRPKEGWEVKQLSEVVDFSNGKAHEQFIDENGNFIVVNSKFVSTEGDIVKYSNQNICPLFRGDITIVMSDIPNGKALAKCYLIEADNRYTLNQRIGSIRPKDGDSKYFYYQLNRNKYFLAFDSGTGQTNLKKNDILECPISLPQTLIEQTKIAQILSDMDAEIEALEKKLNKYKMIKQGMMQNLLSGEIRLV